MFLNSKPDLHLMDESAHCSTACVLKNQSSREIWKQTSNLCFMTYMPPDHLAVDQGSTYISQEMKANVEAAGVGPTQLPLLSVPSPVVLISRSSSSSLKMLR